MWLGYCAFHLGNYEKAIDAYQVRELVMVCGSFNGIGWSNVRICS